MAKAKLKFDQNEITIGEDPTTFGRTADNVVSFTNNPNISRNHAQIEFRDGRFWLTDLGSSNGTAINGQRIEGETLLNDGDFITLGNSVIVEFLLEDAAPEDGAPYESVESSAPPEAGKKAASKSLVMLGITGALCGLAVVFVAASVLIPYMMTPAVCEATARISSPDTGEVIAQETEVRIDVRDSGCVGRVIVVLNGSEIASLTEPPYTTQLDPKNFPELADGGLYRLQVVLEDLEGNKLVQSSDIALQFETKEIKPATPVPAETDIETPTPPAGRNRQVTLIDVQKMTAAVVGKFQTGGRYNLSNPEFLREVQKKTSEYVSEGYFERAVRYQDLVNQSFVREKSLDPALGFILAMSRSKFVPDSRGINEGLWQMSNDFATANAYIGACGTPTLSDTTQECAAKIAALYLEDLVIKVFDGDIVYGVAAFGQSFQEANMWKSTLPPDRSDFWKNIADIKQREEVVRFFAAAIVAENPQRFGLKKDRPISELYPPVVR